jgi:hypothetical protein
MKFTRLTASAIAFVWLAAGTANAQSIDWRSETNRTFWNAISMAELQELAEEAGAEFTPRPARGTDLYARLEWPGLNPVTVLLSDCTPLNSRQPVCTAMRFHIPELPGPKDYFAYNRVSSDWVTTYVEGEHAAIYRTEFLNFGTTRGHVLGTLVQFRREATAEIALLNQHAAD